eukprot:scaffold37504_cov58-Phaeocystis_antarctica.AAC.3
MSNKKPRARRVRRAAGTQARGPERFDTHKCSIKSCRFAGYKTGAGDAGGDEVHRQLFAQPRAPLEAQVCRRTEGDGPVAATGARSGTQRACTRAARRAASRGAGRRGRPG